MTELDILKAIGAASDELVARSEKHPIRRTRRTTWILLAAVLLALTVTACTVAIHYRLIPWFGIVESREAGYSNAEQVAFTQTLHLKETLQGQGILTYAVAVNDQFIIRIDGEFLDGGNTMSSGRGGAEGDIAEGVRLLVADQAYQTSGWTEYYSQNTSYEQIFSFDVPTKTLSAGMTVILELSESDADPTLLRFTLKPAAEIRDLSSIGAGAESDFVDIAAEVRSNGSDLAVELFCINRTNMELVCYGMGKGYELVEPALDSLRLETKNGTVYADRISKLAAVPHTLYFTDAAAQRAVMKIPYVILKHNANEGIDLTFSTVTDALAWKHSISLPYARLDFSIVQNDEGDLVLHCQVNRLSDQFRLVGFGCSNSKSDLVIPDEGDIAQLSSDSTKLTDDRTLNDSLHLVFDLPYVTYALITDFSISLG